MSSQLVQFLEDRAGTLHRGTVRYEADGIEFLHLREDLSEDQLRDQIEGILARLRPEGTGEEDFAFVHLGSLEATVRVFEHAVILHFPTGRDHGVVVSLDPGAARELNTFIDECQQRLRS